MCEYLPGKNITIWLDFPFFFPGETCYILSVAELTW
uniref:Uncharacterized protein n=1 Tax=Arundo donax TaxID=35708 RepID=A0A0A8YXH4_ARUDO